MKKFFPRLVDAAVLTLLAVTVPAHAERADRSKKVTIEADQPGTIDLLKQVVVFNGNVVVAQGTLIIRADRVEVRQSPEGFRSAVATGSASRPATFRQKRDEVNEYVEGSGQRIDYDSRNDTVVMTGNAQARRLRGSEVADEITGQQITYDNVAERFSVAGGSAAASPSNPGGRVRMVLTPREEPASVAAPAAGGASAAPLRSSGSLGESR